MKRVIEIDEKDFKAAQRMSDGWVIATAATGKLIRHIAISTPLDEALDKIRTEIDNAYENLDGYDPDSLGTLISKVDEIIDKYKES